MRIHRFILPIQLHGGEVTITDEALINQWRNVLRLEAGDTVQLCDGNNTEALATIDEVQSKFIRLSVSNPTASTKEASRRVTLYCAIVKRENFELIAQKATECGIYAIVPVRTERTVKQNVSLERVQRIMHEASEQSGRGSVPSVLEPKKLNEALTHAKQNDLNICFDMNGQPFTSPPITSVGIFIGPEGGWSEKEIAAFAAHTVTIASLGARTLRAETAAIVACYLATR